MHWNIFHRKSILEQVKGKWCDWKRLKQSKCAKTRIKRCVDATNNKTRGKGGEQSVTSNNVRSVPPVMFHTIPVALSIPISNKGDWMAFKAASLALVFPEV